MGTTLATKQDMEALKLATKQDLLLLKQELTGRITELRQDMESRFALQNQKIDTLELRLTVKLGSMLIVGFGLTIAAMRFWM